MLIPDDTIVALSSAPGSAARGIIRLSGPDAFRLAGEVLAAEDCQDASDAPGAGENDKTVSCRRTLTVCRLDDKTTCPAEVIFFHSPHSYTTQDLVELHLPGSPALLKMVLDRLLTLGARQAQPGEFTARAFFNGRIDLSQAEAVAELIHAQSDAQLRAAGRLLDGALNQKCQSLQNHLSEIIAQVEAGIDFSQEEDIVELVRPKQLFSQLEKIQRELGQLIETSISWEQLDHLPQVVLAGPANAGKSSLANALLGIDRSIISSVAGTTRDVLSAPLKLEHGECLLIDTAGLGPVEDPLAERTQAAARKQIRSADLVLYVVDIIRPDPGDDLADLDQLDAGSKIILVANKMDLVDEPEKRLSIFSKTNAQKVLAVSALRGDHLDELKSLIYKNLHDRPCDGPAGGVALSTRQRRALAEANENLNQAILLGPDAVVTQPEIFALYLQEAMNQLGTISGQIVNEDILGLIFSRFCVGK